MSTASTNHIQQCPTMQRTHGTDDIHAQRTPYTDGVRQGVTPPIVHLCLLSNEPYLLLSSTSCVHLSNISMLTCPFWYCSSISRYTFTPPSCAHPSPSSHPCPSLPAYFSSALTFLSLMLVSDRSHVPEAYTLLHYYLQKC